MCWFPRNATPVRGTSTHSLDVVNTPKTPGEADHVDKKARPTQRSDTMPAARKTGMPIKMEVASASAVEKSAPVPKPSAPAKAPCPMPSQPSAAKPAPAQPIPAQPVPAQPVPAQPVPAQPVPAPSALPKGAAPVKRELHTQNDAPIKKATPPKVAAPVQNKAPALPPAPTMANHVKTEPVTRVAPSGWCTHGRNHIKLSHTFNFHAHSSDTSHNFLPLAEPKQPTSQGSRDHVCTDQQWEHKPCSPRQWSSHCSKGIRPVQSPQSTSPTTSSNATQSTCKNTTASKVTASKGTTPEGHPSVFNCSCISFWLPSSAWNSSPAARWLQRTPSPIHGVQAAGQQWHSPTLCPSGICRGMEWSSQNPKPSCQKCFVFQVVWSRWKLGFDTWVATYDCSLYVKKNMHDVMFFMAKSARGVHMFCSLTSTTNQDPSVHEPVKIRNWDGEEKNGLLGWNSKLFLLLDTFQQQ